MAKLTLNDLENLENETTVVSAINANNAAIEAALENTLSRDGTTPNPMLASLDMNSQRIINLPQPATATEPLRLQDLEDFVGGSLTINAINSSAAGRLAYYATAGAALSGAAQVTVDAGIAAQGGTTNINFYPFNTSNGVQITRGTADGAGAGGAITLWCKNINGSTSAINEELGFLQVAGWDGTNYSANATPALVFITTQAWTPSAQGCAVLFQSTIRGTNAAVGEVSIGEGLKALGAGAVGPFVGQGIGTLDSANGTYDAGKRVLSASNPTMTVNQNNSTQLSLINSTNNTAAVAAFATISDVSQLLLGSAATAYSSAFFAGRSFVIANSDVIVGSSAAKATIISVSGAEIARFNGTTPGQLTLGLAGTTVGKLALTNATSGSIVLTSPAGALGSSVLTLPVATDTLVGKATTDTLTNKSIDAGQLTGSVAAARMPAFTGDVTTSAGVVATTLATVNANVGTFGSATKSATVTVNAKGLVTAASETTIAIAMAAQSDQETASSTTLPVTPGRQQYHPSAAKAWVSFTGSTGAILASYNVASVVRNAAGDYTVTWSVAFSSANYACSAVNVKGAAAAGAFPALNSQAAGNVNLWAFNTAFALTDPTTAMIVAFGDQ